ncbi:hypothetical protein [Henriciella aquimarina]|uniref:hypothetical protein n=1 Tax=Henriciella aquimarina TaxID=545261 RepID=UPI000A043DE6|nr:hypothetical protein [Henriciella aquimarina]
MRHFHHRLAAAVLAPWLLIGLAACNPSEPTDPPAPEVPEETASPASSETVEVSEASRKEAAETMRNLADGGNETMRMVVSLKAHRPDIYDEFIEALGLLIETGNFEQEAAYEAGAAIRPKLLAAFGEAMMTASDSNLEALVAHTTDTYQELVRKAPQECVRNINGLPPSDADVISDSMQRRETDIMIAIFEEGPVGDIKTASREDLMDWMLTRLQANPDHMEAFGLPAGQGLSDTDATRYCAATIFVMEELLKEEQPRTAALFRAMSALEG